MVGRPKKSSTAARRDLPAAAAAYEVRPIHSLATYHANSRTHTGSQVAEIAASLREFGFVGAVVVRAGVIAKGHGTLAACRSIYADGDLLYPAPGQAAGAKPLPEGCVPVLDVTGWSEAHVRAYVIADNKLALNAGWDDALLVQEFEALEELDFDISVLGFNEAELDILRQGELLPIGAEGDGEGASGVQSVYLQIAKVKIPMTEVEAAGMAALLARYGAECGSNFGFASWIIEQVG